MLKWGPCYCDLLEGPEKGTPHGLESGAPFGFFFFSVFCAPKEGPGHSAAIVGLVRGFSGKCGFCGP